MSKVIALANQKGGVGKTTTTINLASHLSAQGKSVLVVDLDPQGNASSGLGLEKGATENSVYELLFGACTPEECMLHLSYDTLRGKRKISLLPSRVDLAGAEVELVDMENKEYLLRERLEPLRERFDYILIDCPPSLSLLTVNALTTANSVLIPVQCEYYALEGLAQLLDTISLVRENLHPELQIEGLVFTMYDARTNLSRQVVEDVRENLDIPIFETTIPRNIRLAEAPSYGRPVDLYDRWSLGAKSYKRLAKELIQKNENEIKQNENNQFT